MTETMVQSLWGPWNSHRDFGNGKEQCEDGFGLLLERYYIKNGISMKTKKFEMKDGIMHVRASSFKGKANIRELILAYGGV